MSLLNKFMHPRNIYKTPPNFKELAIAYPEFRSIAKQDISGKIMIDFKDQVSLRALTTTLLKKDFDLNVEIPVDRLVPTLPLRLNYLLWIEDLLESTNIVKTSNPILGVDIGTGASSIYPLLAAKKNKWHMKATEMDSQSFECANRNIERNNLQELIKIQQVKSGTILKDALNVDVTYDFSMCNPPFFSSEQDLDGHSKSRSTSRPPPHNAQTGAIGEVVTKGGEIAFVSQMIKESEEMKTRIRIYTTMVGQKSSVGVLKAELQKAGVVSCSQTEFCQGHTTRWGLAWTFNSNISLPTKLPKTSRKKDRKKPALKYIVPKTCNLPEYNVTEVSTKLEALLGELKLECEDTTRNKHMASYRVVALENTWCNQRRKRRELKNNLAQKLSPPTTVGLPSVDEDWTPVNTGKRSLSDSTQEDGNKRKKLNLELDECVSSLEKDDVKSSLQNDFAQPSTEKGENLLIENTKRKVEVHQCPLLRAQLVVKKVSGEVNIELAWLEGSSGREAAHQVLQYIKNNLFQSANAPNSKSCKEDLSQNMNDSKL